MLPTRIFTGSAETRTVSSTWVRRSAPSIVLLRVQPRRCPNTTDLDQYVAGALNRLCGLSWPTDGWTDSQYADYLDLARRWADQWDTQPDVVECVLFWIGKAPRLAVEVLAGLSPVRLTPSAASEHLWSRPLQSRGPA